MASHETKSEILIFSFPSQIITWSMARLGRHGTRLTRSASAPARLSALSTRPDLDWFLTQCSMWSSNWELLFARPAFRPAASISLGRHNMISDLNLATSVREFRASLTAWRRLEGGMVRGHSVARS